MTTDETSDFLSMTDLLNNIHDTQHVSKYFELQEPIVKSLDQPKSSRVPSEIHHQTKAITMTTTKEQQPEKQK
ncbi:unnamed protein product, partial [Rotaria sordida]